MTALPAVCRGSDHGAGCQRAADLCNRRRPYFRHVRERDDPSCGVARPCNTMRERVPHALHCLFARRHATAFLLEHIRERKIAGSHDSDHIEICSNQIASGMHGDRNAVIERMNELSTAESSACACSEQYADDGLLSSHVTRHYSGRPLRLDSYSQGNNMQARTARPVRMLVNAAATLAIVSTLAALAAGPASNAGLWHYR